MTSRRTRLWLNKNFVATTSYSMLKKVNVNNKSKRAEILMQASYINILLNITIVEFNESLGLVFIYEALVPYNKYITFYSTDELGQQGQNFLAA